MGKEEVDIFFRFSGDIWKVVFLQKCLLSSQSSTFRKTFVQIAWAAKRVNFHKNVKKNLPRNRKMDKADTGFAYMFMTLAST